MKHELRIQEIQLWLVQLLEDDIKRPAQPLYSFCLHGHKKMASAGVMFTIQAKEGKVPISAGQLNQSRFNNKLSENPHSVTSVSISSAWRASHELSLLPLSLQSWLYLTRHFVKLNEVWVLLVEKKRRMNFEMGILTVSASDTFPSLLVPTHGA